MFEYSFFIRWFFRLDNTPQLFRIFHFDTRSHHLKHNFFARNIKTIRSPTFKHPRLGIHLMLTLSWQPQIPHVIPRPDDL